MKLKRLMKKRKNRYLGICRDMCRLHQEKRVSVINAELNPCPFCGGTSLTIDYDIDGKGWYISCDNIFCNCSILQDTEEEAIKAWNRRMKDGKSE